LEGKDNQVEALQQYLQSNPTINALCYIPLNMTILLCLAEDGIDGLPKTQTDLYEKFIKMTVQRFIQKTKGGSSINISSITDLPYPHNEVFKELAQLAFNALKIDKIIFNLSEIRSLCPDLSITQVNRDGLGLLKAVPYFNKQTGNKDITFHFLHFSIQEYMSAYYISTLQDSKQIDLLRAKFWEPRYYNTWIMYVGITDASSFALRHFLSGNKIRLITKFTSKLGVSSRLLNDKVKCLHLFQCLVESKDKKIASLVGNFLKGQEIDLSGQTLIPSDLNTLGFFLCRSITKRWTTLNLSKCSIGVIGCDILCNRLLDAKGHDTIHVKKVDLSYNQLTFSCLSKLFGLFKSWHTSEVIITDDAILNSVTSINLFAAVEQEFIFYYSQHTLTLLLVGSFLYVNSIKERKILEHLTNITDIQSMYLMHCVWDSMVTEFVEWQCTLKKHSLTKIHIIGDHINDSFIAALASLLSSDADLFIYDPFLPDKIANGLIDTPLLNECAKVIVSHTKTQGVVRTHSLSNKLSPLELLNLCVCISNCNLLKSPPWKQKEPMHTEFAFDMLVQQHLFKKTCHCQLRLVLSEHETIFVSKTKVEYGFKAITPLIKLLYAVNSSINKYDIELLYTKLFSEGCMLRELFIHGILDVDTNDVVKLLIRDCYNTSSLLVSNSTMIGHNPTANQVALAFQLEPSITICKLPNCQVTADVFYQLTNWLTTIPNNWTELDLEGCIGDAECEIIQKQVNFHTYYSTVKTLNISSNQLTTAIIPALIDIILNWKVQQCTIKGVDSCFRKFFIDGLAKTKVLKSFVSESKLSISVITSNYISCFFYGVDLNDIRTLNDHVTEVYIVNCNIKTFDQVLFCLTSNFNLTTSLEVSIYDKVVIDSNTLISEANILHNTNIRSILLTVNFLYQFNVTQRQLQFLQHIRQWRCHSVESEKETSVNEENLFVKQSKALEIIYFISKQCQVMLASHINIVLCGITTLKKIGIENYNITDKTADDIVTILSYNTKLEEISINFNNFQPTGATKILRHLHCMPEIQIINFRENHVNAAENVTLLAIDMNGSHPQVSSAEKIGSTMYNCEKLKAVKISNNNFSSEVPKLIGSTLHHAKHLQELDVSQNNFQALDCALICKAMQGQSSLTKLILSQNKITDAAVDNLAIVLSQNTQLQELDLSYNKFTAAGIAKISEAMKNIKKLKVLKMAHTNINTFTAEFIADFLRYNLLLQELDFHDNDLQASGCSIICKALDSKLNKLVFSKNGITDKAAKDIASLLLYNELKEIYINQNYFQTESIKKIAVALENKSSLLKLYLGNNSISNEAVDYIAHILWHNKQLQELELQIHNCLPSDCMKISHVLQHTSTLLKLILINSNITSESADSIAAILFHNAKLEVLILDGNDLQAAGISKVFQGLIYTSTLLKLSIQDNHCTEDAANDIAQVISHNTELQDLNLQGNDLQTKGVKAVITALKMISKLIRLNMSNNGISDEVVNDVAAFISANTQLQEFCCNNCNLTVEGTTMILTAIRKLKNLKVLSLANCSISSTVVSMLQVGIASKNMQLQELDFSENDLQATGCSVVCRVLQKVTTLRKLVLSGNNITDEVTDDLTDVLFKNTHLQVLDLSQNKFGEASTIKIIKALWKCTDLKVLRIANGNVTSTAGEFIAGILYHDVQLAELDLSGNNLKSAGCSAICRAFQGMSLTKLSLLDNNITYEAVDDIGDLLSHNIQMQELQLQFSNLTGIDCIKISHALRSTSSLLKLCIPNSNLTSESAGSIAAVLSHNTQLQELNLDRNSLECLGIMQVLEGLKNTATLLKLSIQDNHCTDDAAIHIAHVMSCNSGLLELNLLGNELKTSCRY